MDSIVFKLPAIVLMALTVGVLLEALYFLSRDHGDVDKTRVARALSIRVSLALALFVMLIAGIFVGLVQPHGL
ncbi:MAG: DUF2909 domain-containing protein [Gammaproteobacteria bacterium]|nr:DUF2909 domain-containing protein [Gammaproteobacteria bacterium]